MAGLRSAQGIARPDNLCEQNCGGGGGGGATSLKVSSSKALLKTNYIGAIVAASNGAFKTVDSNGACFNFELTPGKQLSLARYGQPNYIITPSHPVFSNENFTIGTTTFTNVSAAAGLPMYRFSDSTLGSGAVWLNNSGVYNFAYTGMGVIVAQGGCGNPCGNPAAAPSPCQENAVGMGAIGMIFGIGSLFYGSGAASSSGISQLLGILGLGVSGAGIAPCPSPPTGQPTPNSIMPSLDAGSNYVAGDGTLPDGGGTGDDGTDQWDLLA